MASVEREDYLKAIAELQRNPEDAVSPGAIAKRVGVTPGTCTAMMKRLHRDDFIHYEPYSGATLTRTGQELAIGMIRRHRLIETFLVNTLGYDWSEVHDDAERLEHAISDTFLDRLDQHLCYPEVDPHGDPIPTANGTNRAPKGKPLYDAPLNRPLFITRCTDQDTKRLQWLSDHGLVPGARVTKTAQDDTAGTMTLRFESGDMLTLAITVAKDISAAGQ